MSKGNEVVLELKNVTKIFKTHNNNMLTACRDISLNFYKGETLGIVGESGCGKSTLMKMIMQLEDPTDGEIIYRGQNITKLKGEKLRLNRRNIQMVFQDPTTSFNPRMKIRDIICEPLINFGLIKRCERDEVAKKYLDMVELSEDFLHRYPHNMSGGQRQRIGIARALALNPEVIIFDESTSALDVSIQKSILELITKLQRENDITIGFVCHDIALVTQICHQVVVMYLGNIVEIIPGEKLYKYATHPYTKTLISSVFDLNMDFSKKINCISGDVPSPIDRPIGCPFENCCESAMEICKKQIPKLRELSKNHYIACHLDLGEKNE
ncbi:ABC transporter ATP-binding protein [Terrisporobacter sp.]|uniref:ABC transporter ATP-binding protein n=1 Tax=Terrisporobacter sp. TaxID=1965305 RepID=UPI00261272A2|nr:ABC transporter ATP-binding protein [Terrisporobacter sp.]